ncbi:MULTISPECIES: phenol hydroxylase subunit [Tepidiphilus]|jgi:phenol hydroxylase P0 protein|uniref:Phenol hydroxylase subunit n=1 Tax=Tepidiphilus thermophilus TaxID=876478 RepID=A0A0K6IRF9_9PROT|nr:MULTISPECIES: phenol hydroxylase subunit [Tepidiphilus]CUB05917.1 Phenol hydroxylase subunit [Tepidiphilus thermophilus]
MKPAAEAFDVGRKFVRVLERRPDGLVAFEFAIGEPDLCVDMLLPAEAFARFCEEQQVIHLEGAAREDGLSDWDWSMRTAAQQRFR